MISLCNKSDNYFIFVIERDKKKNAMNFCNATYIVYLNSFEKKKNLKLNSLKHIYAPYIEDSI